MSFATLTGTPIAGALVSHDNGGFTDAIIFSGVVMTMAGVACLMARIAKSGTKILKRS
jgi:hypothetical protein